MAINESWSTSIFGPPETAGVYCVMQCDLSTNERKVLYIGSSNNISRRVLSPSHPYRKLLNKQSEGNIAIYTKHKPTNEYRELEKMLIKKLRPKFNIQHNGETIY